MFPASHPLYFGHEGNYGQRCANFITQNCDLLIAIGTRLAIPQIGYDIHEFAREAKKVVVEIDSGELSKFQQDNSFFPVLSNAKTFIENLLSQSRKLKLISLFRGQKDVSNGKLIILSLITIFIKKLTGISTLMILSANFRSNLIKTRS